MNRFFQAVAAGIIIFIFHNPGISQSPNVINMNERPVMTASTLTAVPVIDGEVIEDELWQQVEAVDELVQTQPNFGQPATERTEIRVAYDAQTFYLAVVCYDATPGQLVVSDARRDASLENTDAFLFILDTYNDGQNGFIFGTNSMGVEYDGQVDNEGQGNINSNRQQGGMVGGFNLNWDASWEVKAKVGDFGWSAEFAIPLRTLRYNSGENQTWGINFRRNIRKTNEVAYWASIPIGMGFDLKRLSLAGKMTGLNLKNPGNLKIIPYGLMGLNKAFENDSSKTQFKEETGIDLKYSITPSMTLDVTYKTDFAQVEVDDQQVNLDRFNLFFPEKRPFFLENGGLFGIGSPGEIDLFFSRRIGISDNGQQVPIIGGARLSGKVNKTNIGALSMFTNEIPDDSIYRNNFSVARVRHELAPRTTIGGAYIGREGIAGMEDDYNRVFALDGKLGLGKKAQMIGFFAHSQSPNTNSPQYALNFKTEYQWNNWNINGAYTEVAEGFNPEVGFLLRKAFHKPEFLIFRTIRLNGKFGLMEIRPHVSYRGYWTYGNFWNGNRFQETGYLHVDNHWVWMNGMELHTGINFTQEGIREPFEISEGVIIPDSSFYHKESQIVFWTNQSKPVFVNIRSNMGGYFGGKRYVNTASLNLRQGDKFNTAISLSHNDYNLPFGDFVAYIFGGKMSYSFTPRMYIQSLVQYNNIADILSINIRYGLLKQANSGLFVVYNETRSKNGPDFRSFVVKYSHVFDVIK